MWRDPDPDLAAIRDSVQWVGGLSDSIVKFGPFSLGVDGILAWIPGIGEVYSLVAGGFLLLQGARAGVPLPVLAACVALMGSRTIVTAVPLAGPLAADVFTAHKWSARMIARAIERRIAAGALAPDARPAGRWARFAG